MHADSLPTSIGAYRVVRVLGAGGWSTVYEVVGPDGQTYALKRLRGDLPATAVARFRREAESLRRIAHAGVLRLVDLGVDGGAPYLVTPRVEGQSLRELLAGGPLGIEAALVIAIAAAEALGAIHAAGLVHRDVKPENLMLSNAGDVVVIDLGLALGPEHSRHTEENALTGSVPYMAPEQIEDRSPTPASDVWALAVVIYEAAAGRRPFQRARQSEEVAAILAGKHEPLAAIHPRCSDELSALLARCLDHAPDRRPPDGAALADALAAHLDWPADLATERARFAADPHAYAATVAPLRAAHLAASARAALAAGDTFTASRHVDRALAITPGDPALRQLLDAVMSGAPPPPAEPDAGATLMGFQAPVRTSANHRVVARPVPSATGVAPSPARRSPLAIALVALGALVVIAGIGIAVRLASQPAARSVDAAVRPAPAPSTIDEQVDTTDPDPEPPPEEPDVDPAPHKSTTTIEKPSSVKPSQPAPPDAAQGSSSP